MVNHFSIMLQRRLREQERGEEDEDEGEKSGKKKKKGGGRGGDLRIHDLEDDLEMSSDNSDSSMGEGKEKDTRRRRDYCKTFSGFHLLIFFLQTLWLYWTDGESKPKVKKDAGKGKAKKKKQKSKDNEALEDSDDGDYEGLEVDYMSDESRSGPFHEGTQRLTLYQQCVFFVFVVLFMYLFCVPNLAQKKNQKRESLSKQRNTLKVRSISC